MRGMRCRLVLALGLMTAPVPVQAQFFFDNFDSYTTGSTIAGQGGWETWAGDPGVDTVVVNTVSYSPPNSLAVSGTADIVHQFSGATSGTWYAKFQTYVPSSQLGNLYFIILNRYDGLCAGSGDCDWSVQVRMSAEDGVVESLGGSNNPSSASPLPIITNQWAEIVVEANLSANSYVVYYNGVPLDSLPWAVTGDINIAAFNLFANGSTESYMDHVSLDAEIPIVHYWPFDGNTLDLAGGSHGTLIGSPVYVPGVAGDGLHFNGLSDAVSAAVNINPATLPAMTMGAWVRTEEGTPIRQVITHDDGLYDRGLCIDSRGSGGTGWSAFVGSHGVMGGGQAATIGLSQLVAVSYNESANEAILYVDGVTETHPTGMGFGFPFINIGRNPYQGGISYFAGMIDEVFISDRALSVAELDRIRSSGRVPGDFPFFLDGFESGNTNFWSATIP